MNDSSLLSDLVPDTEYLVSVVCVYDQRESSPVTATQKTGEFLPESKPWASNPGHAQTLKWYKMLTGLRF